MDWSTYTDDLNIPNNWKCVSYHHDELPSYEVNGFQIYMDSHHISERKINSKNIMGLDNELMPRFMVENDNYEQLFTTNDFKELNAWIEEQNKWTNKN